MQIVTVSYDVIENNVVANVAAHVEHITTIMERYPKTDVVLFPELSISGFVVDDSNLEKALTASGEWLNPIREAARKYAIAVSLGYIEKNPVGMPFNSQMIIDETGEVVANYHKSHLVTASAEPDLYARDGQLSTIMIKGWKCAISTCFDIRFPRLFEAYRKEGVELVLSGMNWVAGRNKPEILEVMAKARAHENQFYMAVVDRVGSEAGVSFTGVSVVANPYAEDIACHEGEYHVAVLDKTVMAEMRKMLPLDESRRESYDI